VTFDFGGLTSYNSPRLNMSMQYSEKTPMNADASNRPAAPAHVAFIMDGNGRWATHRGLPRTAGHRAGILNVEPVALSLMERGAHFMTIYMFSTENWKRPVEEVSAIFDLLVEWLGEAAPRLADKGVQVRHYGRREPLPAALLKQLGSATACSPPNPSLVLGLAINYGGRAEIVDAISRLARDRVTADAIDEDALSDAMYTSGVPEPDLIFRPGGELRLSNYLLWQAAYSELYFSQVLWPDVRDEHLDEALTAYWSRNRRFGGLQARA